VQHGQPRGVGGGAWKDFGKGHCAEKTESSGRISAPLFDWEMTSVISGPGSPGQGNECKSSIDILRL